MKVLDDGRRIILEHVRDAESRPAGDLTKHAVFMVNFDGELDLWFSAKPIESAQQTIECVQELRDYYRHLWAPTSRELTVLYTSQPLDTTTIDCR